MLTLAALAGVLGLGVVQGSAARTHEQPVRPVVVHLKWRLVTSEPSSIVADDRYVAITRNRYPAASPLTLIDQQAHTQRNLVAPGCLSPPGGADPVVFGGPWLIVECAGRPYDGTFELYNLASRQWTTFTVSSQCEGCALEAVGRDWVKYSVVGDCSEHCSVRYVIQNIATGEVKPDPVTAGGRIVDDLNSPSGSRPLCSPLRYPPNYNASAEVLEPGQLFLDRGFALAWGDDRGGSPVYRLERCGSRLNLTLGGPYFSVENTPLLSSRAMAWIQETYPAPNVTFGLTGRLLPGVQRFTAALPPPLRGQDGAIVVALTHRTVYVRTLYRYSQLWAAALPPLKRHSS